MKKYYLWLTNAIVRARKGERKTVYLSELTTKTIDYDMCYSYMQWAMAVGLLHAGIDGRKIYVYEAEATKGETTTDMFSIVKSRLNIK